MTIRQGLAPLDIASRTDRVRAGLGEHDCDALLVTAPMNIRWLTGFTGSAAQLLVRPDELVFVTDGRYRDQAADELATAGVAARIEIVASGQEEILAAAARGIDRLGLEAEDVTWARQRRLASEWFADLELVATEGLVMALRAVKEPAEVARIEAAAAAADAALATVLPGLADGPTETEVAHRLDELLARDADGPAFETIVAAGPNSARPHARPTVRPLREGDLVVIDMGATIDGYRSDMSRTFVLGEPDTEQRRMLEVVTAAQAAGVAAAAGGVACRDVDRACRQLIADAGWDDAFLHGTGHGVGLDIHEPPRVAAKADGTLVAGNVITVEPGVYLSGVGGVRVEDTVAVTGSGCRALTTAPKEPILR